MKDQRVGHAERTQVLGLLGNAFEAGVLPVGEYDARVAAVGGATRASQLRLQVADLPPPYAWGAAGTGLPDHPPGRHAAGAHRPHAANGAPARAAGSAISAGSAVSAPGTAISEPGTAISEPGTAISEPGTAISEPGTAVSAGRPAVSAPRSGRGALILGIASVLFSVCGIGLVLGLLAVIAGRSRGPRAGRPRISMALVGRVLGLIGMALSVAAIAAAFVAWHGRTIP
ncbi:DUF1707 domain-containing protein [Actinoplanes sp. KI2]|uniref:DUF1707 SHOCT-like domain-containing protein n=1 Tax=Actinoplanes sp. KI2 TaxID=2983315 RepID=UPI0021D5DFAF|nr:DUF1707 domain-containing protein [Actinoplanes sp. KI2]MCU7722700.1 DUF1707 domain-containing protein [Actinoplanes sp. KI2]